MLQSGLIMKGLPVPESRDLDAIVIGVGTHPGGGVTGAPGYNAARKILKDRG
jgi:phytoene dehydrogenase-like protein